MVLSICRYLADCVASFDYTPYSFIVNIKYPPRIWPEATFRIGTLRL